jgi:UDP-N-acetylglucosamine 2-epimerase (non-hydrolysing)
MKVMTILGTRPEIIRLSALIPKLDRAVQHVLVHTGQNYAERLNDIFFRELEVRAPDHSLGVRAETAGEQIGRILIECERVMLAERPDVVLILGDTNSALSALVARRLGIPVYHMEAGNRCYDDRVPEEINRRVVDHSSSVLLPYTARSKDNLVREGIARERIFVTGNPIFEVLERYREGIAASDAAGRLGLARGRYFLVTMHRQENVDVEPRLRDLVTGLGRLASEYGQPVVCSLHPRTRARMESFGVGAQGDVRFVEPLGFLDFVALERDARCIVSDSGTVQEEACILRVPNVTIRDVTERPETIECGSNLLAGTRPDALLRAVETALAEPPAWTPPAEYLEPNVSGTVLRILQGHRPGS